MPTPSKFPSPQPLPEHPIPCPRCGYDQRGPVATWTNTCPLAGKCSECGLDFPWCDLLNPNLIRPKWCVEYADKWWNIPGISLRTLLMMFRPRSFWSRLKMSHEVRWKRLIGFIILLILFQYLVFASSVGWSVRQQITQRNGPSSQASISSLYAALLPFSTNPPPWYFTTGLKWGRVIPIAPFDVVSYRQGMYWNMTGVASTFIMRHHGSYPFSRTIIAATPFSMISFALCLLAPLGFALLPISRKQAKVRWFHIARITLYSLVIVTGFNLFIFVRYASLPPYWGNPMEVIFWESSRIILWIIPLFLIIWWSMATRHYLKMPHAWGVACSIVVMAMLLGPGLFIAVVMLL